MVTTGQPAIAGDANCLSRVGQLIEELQSAAPSSLSPYVKRPGEKLVRLIAMNKVANLHRTLDLSDAARHLFAEQRLVPGCTLTRAVFESVANCYYLIKKLAASTRSIDIPELADFAIRGCWGSKDGTTDLVALHVLTSIDHMSKEFGFVRKEYEHLCEYAHPNFKGSLGTFGAIDKATLAVTYGVNPQALSMETFGLGSLELILEIQNSLESRFSEVFPIIRERIYEGSRGIYSE